MVLCDTSVLIELSRTKPNPGVLAWAEDVSALALSVVTVEEVFYGLATRPNPKVRAWFEDFIDSYCQILDITPQIAKLSGQLRGDFTGRGETRSQADMLIVATAQFHQLTLVTRNVRHFEGCSVPLLNPFH